MRRRTFLAGVSGSLAGLTVSRLAKANESAPRVVLAPAAGDDFPHVSSLRAVTEMPGHHFFGYYIVSPWNPSQARMVCLRSAYSDKPPVPGDTAAILVAPFEAGDAALDWETVGETRAWNFQQGCMMHWLPTEADTLVYNDIEDGQPFLMRHHLATGAKDRIGRPIAALTDDGTRYANLSYSRLQKYRGGYGYIGASSPSDDELRPEDDGLWVVDTATGAELLAASIADVYRISDAPDRYENNPMWLSLAVWNPAGSRVFFLGRFKNVLGSLITGGFTVGSDGSDLRQVISFRENVSHVDWISDSELVLTTQTRGKSEWQHVRVVDGEAGRTRIAPEILTDDGHCTVAPSGEWMITDTYPRGEDRYQILYATHLQTGRTQEIARFVSPEPWKREWRCDLHPRWSPDGTMLCIDSPHSDTRQVYVLEIANV